MNTVENIKTVKAGREYYATVNDIRLHYLINDDNSAVMVCDKHRRYGGFLIERFGGRLSPDGIRRLHEER